MATSTTSKNTPQVQAQEKKIVHGDQEAKGRQQAQELLNHLRVLLMNSNNPGMDIISDSLQKVEQFSLEAARQPHMDPETGKTLEDISTLLLSARQLAQNKGIADRLEKISEEARKAIESTKKGGVSVTPAAKKATEILIEYTTTWRPLFYLIVSSRDFRQLTIDTLRIARNIAGQYKDTVGEEAKEKYMQGEPVKDIAKDAKEEIKQKGAPEMSEDEWNILLDDIQRVLVTLSREPAYKEGLENIFKLLDKFQEYMANEVPTAEAGPKENIHVRRVVTETEDLVAAFSGRETLEEFKFNLRKLLCKFHDHPDIQSYLSELKQFILKAKSEEEIRSEEFKKESKQLASRGRALMRDLKDDEDINNFFDSANNMLENIKNDEFLQILQHHAGIVQSDISYVDSEGKTQVDTDMLTRLQTNLLPVLADALKYIPIPRVYSNDVNREFSLENIVLCSYDLLPENVRFHLESDSEVSIRDIQVKDSHTFLVIQLNRLLTELKDVKFYYHKKTFPELEDSGLVTFRIKGEGARLRFVYKVIQGPKDALPKIQQGYASFWINDMDIEFDKSSIKHDVLIPMLTQMFKTQIKFEIERQVENNLNGFMHKLGDQITSSISQVNRPLLAGLEAARKAVKSTDIAQIYEKRREKLE